MAEATESLRGGLSLGLRLGVSFCDGRRGTLGLVTDLTREMAETTESLWVGGGSSLSGRGWLRGGKRISFTLLVTDLAGEMAETAESFWVSFSLRESDSRSDCLGHGVSGALRLVADLARQVAEAAERFWLGLTLGKSLGGGIDRALQLVADLAREMAETTERLWVGISGTLVLVTYLAGKVTESTEGLSICGSGDGDRSDGGKENGGDLHISCWED